MKTNVLIQYVVALSMILMLTACGGGGGGGGDEVVPQQAVLALGITGDNGVTVGAVEAAVTIPAGFTLPVDANGDLMTTGLSSRLPADTIFDYNYTPPTSTTEGSLLLSIMRAEGFSTGELVRMVRPLTPGENLPDVSAFAVVLTAYDLNGVVLPGVSNQVAINTEPVP